jgi:hypothetical protein
MTEEGGNALDLQAGELKDWFHLTKQICGSLHCRVKNFSLSSNMCDITTIFPAKIVLLPFFFLSFSFFLSELYQRKLLIRQSFLYLSLKPVLYSELRSCLLGKKIFFSNRCLGPEKTCGDAIFKLLRNTPLKKQANQLMWYSLHNNPTANYPR